MTNFDANIKVQRVFGSFCLLLASEETLFERIIEDLTVSPRETLEICFNYCQFLVLKWRYPDELIEPSVSIDTVWHQCILHTESYEKFCIENFGRTIHNRPTNSGHSYERTLELLKESFGIEINV